MIMRRKTATSLLLILLVIAPVAIASATAEALRHGFTSSYALSYKGIEIGVTERNLISLGDGTLVFKSTAYPTGLAAALLSDRIVERSLLKIDDSRIQPVEYSYRQSGGKKTRESDVYFSWPRGEIIIRPDDNQVPLPEGTLDVLGFQLALMRDLEAGEQSFTYPIADRRKLREYRFEVGDRENVETPYGRFDAIYVRAESTEEDRTFEFWCAPELGYLPVQIIYDDGDDKSRMVLNEYAGPGS